MSFISTFGKATGLAGGPQALSESLRPRSGGGNAFSQYGTQPVLLPNEGNTGATSNPSTPQTKDPFDTIASLYGAAMGPQTSGQTPQYVVVPPAGPGAGGGGGTGLNPTFVGIAAVAIVGWFVYRWWKKRHQ